MLNRGSTLLIILMKGKSSRVIYQDDPIIKLQAASNNASVMTHLFLDFRNICSKIKIKIKYK